MGKMKDPDTLEITTHGLQNDYTKNSYILLHLVRHLKKIYKRTTFDLHLTVESCPTPRQTRSRSEGWFL